MLKVWPWISSTNPHSSAPLMIDVKCFCLYDWFLHESEYEPGRLKSYVMTSDADTALYKSFIHPYTRKHSAENYVSQLQISEKSSTGTSKKLISEDFCREFQSYNNIFPSFLVPCTNSVNFTSLSFVWYINFKAKLPGFYGCTTTSNRNLHEVKVTVCGLEQQFAWVGNDGLGCGSSRVEDDYRKFWTWKRTWKMSFATFLYNKYLFVKIKEITVERMSGLYIKCDM